MIELRQTLFLQSRAIQNFTLLHRSTGRKISLQYRKPVAAPGNRSHRLISRIYIGSRRFDVFIFHDDQMLGHSRSSIRMFIGYADAQTKGRQDTCRQFQFVSDDIDAIQYASDITDTVPKRFRRDHHILRGQRGIGDGEMDCDLRPVAHLFATMFQHSRDAMNIGATLSSSDAQKAAISDAADAFRKRIDQVQTGQK